MLPIHKYFHNEGDTKKIINISTTLLMCTTLSLAVLTCKKSEETFIPFTNPLDSCLVNNDAEFPHIYDRLHDIKFKLSPEWKVDFNDSMNITFCIDTIASDQHKKLRMFTVSSAESVLPLLDFFTQELKSMKQDSVVILNIGKLSIDNLQGFYAIVEAAVEDNLTNTAFFYVKRSNIVLTFQLGVSKSDRPIQEMCSLLFIINSVSIMTSSISATSKPYLSE